MSQIPIWDGILINALAAFLVEPTPLRGEQEERVALIAQAAAHVSIANSPRMARLVGLTEMLVAAFPDRGRPEGASLWARARLEASAAVAEVLGWRMRQLLHRLDSQGGR